MFDMRRRKFSRLLGGDAAAGDAVIGFLAPSSPAEVNSID